MPRDIQASKIRRALRRIERARALADNEDDRRQLSEWEAEFIASLEERLEEFGSAFADPEKGDLSEPLSALQKMKIREIEKKAKGKDRKPWARGGGLKTRKPMSRGKGFSGHKASEDQAEPDYESEPPSSESDIENAADQNSEKDGAPKRPGFRVIEGGKD